MIQGTSDQISKIIFAWEVDRNSINRASSELQQRFKRVQTAAGATNRALATTTRLLNKEFEAIGRTRTFDNLIASIQTAVRRGADFNAVLANTTRALADLSAKQPEIKRVAEALAEVSVLAQNPSSTLARVQSAIGGDPTAGGGRRQGGLGRAGRELFLLPDVPIAGGLSTTEVSRGMILVDALFQKLGGTLSELALPLGAIGLVGAGLAVVFVELNRRFQETIRRVEQVQQAFIDFNRQVVQGATSGDIRQQLDTQRAEQAGLQTQAAVVQQIIDEFDAALNNAQGSLVPTATLEDLNRRIAEASFGAITDLGNQNVFREGALSGGLGAAIAFVNGLNESAGELSVSIAVGETQLQSAAVAANDHAAALQAEIDELQAAVDHEVELGRLRRQGTSEQVKEQIEANADQQDALIRVNQAIRDQIDANQGNEDALDLLYNQLFANHAQIQDLIDANEELKESVLPIIELREREAELAEGLKEQTDEYLEALEREGELRGDLAEAQQEFADALAETEAKLADIREQLQEKMADAEEKRLEAIAEFEEKIAEKRIEIAENLAERAKKIEERFASDRLNAIGDRDALAAFQAKQKADEELKELRESEQKQLRELEKGKDKQLEAIQKRYNKEIETAQRAADRAITQENERWNRELTVRQQAMNAINTQLQNFVNAQIAISNQLAYTQGAAANYGGTPVTVPLPGGGSQPGWAVPVTPIYPGQPGYVNQYNQPAALNHGGGGGLTANFNVQGMTPTQVRREIDAGREELVRVMFGGRTVAA